MAAFTQVKTFLANWFPVLRGEAEGGSKSHESEGGEHNFRENPRQDCHGLQRDSSDPRRIREAGIKFVEYVLKNEPDNESEKSLAYVVRVFCLLSGSVPDAEKVDVLRGSKELSAYTALREVEGMEGDYEQLTLRLVFKYLEAKALRQFRGSPTDDLYINSTGSIVIQLERLGSMVRSGNASQLGAGWKLLTETIPEYDQLERRLVDALCPVNLASVPLAMVVGELEFDPADAEKVHTAIETRDDMLAMILSSLKMESERDGDIRLGMGEESSTDGEELALGRVLKIRETYRDVQNMSKNISEFGLQLETLREWELLNATAIENSENGIMLKCCANDCLRMPGTKGLLPVMDCDLVDLLQDVEIAQSEFYSTAYVSADGKVRNSSGEELIHPKTTLFPRRSRKELGVYNSEPEAIKRLLLMTRGRTTDELGRLLSGETRNMKTRQAVRNALQEVETLTSTQSSEPWHEESRKAISTLKQALTLERDCGRESSETVEAVESVRHYKLDESVPELRKELSISFGALRKPKGYELGDKTEREIQLAVDGRRRTITMDKRGFLTTDGPILATLRRLTCEAEASFGFIKVIARERETVQDRDVNSDKLVELLLSKGNGPVAARMALKSVELRQRVYPAGSTCMFPSGQQASAGLKIDRAVFPASMFDGIDVYVKDKSEVYLKTFTRILRLEVGSKSRKMLHVEETGSLPKTGLRLASLKVSRWRIGMDER